MSRIEHRFRQLTQLEKLPMNQLKRDAVTENVVKDSLSEYDKSIATAYDTALLHSDGECLNLGLDLIPEAVKEERVPRLSKKFEEYNDRLINFHAFQRPMYLAPEQAFIEGYGERIRRGMLKMIIDKGGLNTYLYYEALQKVEGMVNMNQYLGSINAINDYLVKGETRYGSRLPE